MKWNKYNLFNKWYRTNWTFSCNKDIDLTPFTKINSKQITDLNVNCRTTKLLEDNTGINPSYLIYGDVFLDTTPKPQSIKEKIGKLDFIIIRNFCSTKDTVKRMER